MVFDSLDKNIPAISALLAKGSVGVIPSDTLYGFSCSALNKASVEKIYELKQRESTKPFIILIDSISRLIDFGIVANTTENNILEKLWPNKISVILDCGDEKFEYLHRGTKQIAFRIPKYEELLQLLKISGPIVSTTVNVSGDEPINNIARAKATFGEKVDFYVDLGPRFSTPTTVVKLSNGFLSVVRQGDYVIPSLMLKY